MKILFLDDSRQKDKNNNKYYGYGGFCIDANNTVNLFNDFYKITKKY